MRVNVYGGELTDEVELVQEEVDDQVRFGMRVLLKSPDTMAFGGRHSGVTFWLENDSEGNPNWAIGRNLLANLGITLHEAWMRFHDLRGSYEDKEFRNGEPHPEEPDVEGRDIARD